jgi:hypothetical protein
VSSALCAPAGDESAGLWGIEKVNFRSLPELTFRTT